jgi:rod shape-determining protein MreD
MSLRRPLLIAGLLLFMLVLRNAIFVQLRLFDALPELVLTTVVAVALIEGPESAAIVGFAGGFLQDVSTSITPVGLSCLAFVLVGFGIGIANAYVLRPGRLLGPALAAIATFGAALIAILAGAVVGLEYLVSTYQLHVAFWASLYSAAAFPFVLAFVRRVLELSRVPRASSA